MTGRRRAFPFEGSDSDYIRFLESSLFSLLSQRRPPGSPDVRHILGEDVNRAAEIPMSTCSPSEPLSQQPRLEIIPYRHGEKRNYLKERPRWQKQLDEFRRGIPGITQWQKLRKESAYMTSTQNKLVIDALLETPSWVELNKPTLAPTVLTICTPKYGSWIRNSYSYARGTADLQLQTRLAIKIGYFRELMVVSTCVVMEKAGVALKDIDAIMAACVRSTGSSNMLDYRRGAVWANKCISELSEKGWGNLSSEVFLLCESTC